MFGQDSIYGNKILNVDKKNRILLPSFTFAEEKDRLVIVKSDVMEDSYEIQLQDYIDDLLQDLENKLIEAKVLKTDEEYKRLKLEFYKKVSSVLKTVVCDSQRRINVLDIDNEAKQFECIGAKDHVILKSIK